MWGHNSLVAKTPTGVPQTVDALEPGKRQLKYIQESSKRNVSKGWIDRSRQQ